MKYLADLHVHARYCIATSKNAGLEGYWWWGRIKGIDLIGTGDFTHPACFRELTEKLRAVGSGFFRLKEAPPSQTACFPRDEFRCREREVHFCLSTEISSIYKKKVKPAKRTAWSSPRGWKRRLPPCGVRESMPGRIAVCSTWR